MALTAAQAANLTTDELLRFAQTEQGPLTSSPLELEITERLSQLAESEERLGVLDEFDEVSPSDLRDLLERAPDVQKASQLLSVLLDEDLTEPAVLRSRLALAEKLHALFSHPSDVIRALETIANTAITEQTP